jgi:hypothetical protein
MVTSRVFNVRPAFGAARSSLLESYPNANQAFSDIKSLFSRDTVYGFFDKDRHDHQFTPRVQDKLISFVFNEGEHEYNSIARKIDQSAEDLALISRHLGNYTYWRYNIQGLLVCGDLSIQYRDGIYVFEHYNSIRPRPIKNGEVQKPDHEGYVFALKNRMHFHGMGPKYIRPIISNVVDFVDESYVDGIVMTVQKGTLALMAARFVMIHETHIDYTISKSSQNYEDFARRIAERIFNGNVVRGVLITSDE